MVVIVLYQAITCCLVALTGAAAAAAGAGTGAAAAPRERVALAGWTGWGPPR